MDDYISREAVLKRFEQLKDQTESLRDKLYLDGVAAVIDTLPAADVVEVVHAKWVNPHWLGSTSAANCSVCNFEAQHREYRGVEKFYKYCPGCNAKMDLED